MFVIYKSKISNTYRITTNENEKEFLQYWGLPLGFFL